MKYRGFQGLLALVAVGSVVVALRTEPENFSIAPVSVSPPTRTTSSLEDSSGGPRLEPALLERVREVVSAIDPKVMDTAAIGNQREIIVRVVDRSGRPIGDVPVGIEAANEPLGAFFARHEARTDAAGEARFPVELLDTMDFAATDALRAGVVWPLDPPCVVSRLRSEAAKEGFLLVLEEGCRVEVVVTRDGHTPLVPVTVELEIRRDGEADFVAFDSRVVTAGRATFLHVPCDTELRATARYHGERFSTDERWPHRSRRGELAELDIELPGLCRLEFRVLSAASGAPLRTVELDVERIGGIDLGPPTVRHRSDETGRVVVAWPNPDRLSCPPRLHVSARSPENGHAEIDLATRLEDGRIELGNLRLIADPLIASGRVVDVAGNAIRGARIDASAERYDDLQPTWFQPSIDDAFAISDQDGAFELRDRRDDSQILLAVSASGFARRSALFTRGTSGLEIRLERTGSIGGSITLPTGWDSRVLDSMRIQCSSTGLDPIFGRVLEGSGHRVSPDGTFLIENRIAGQHRVDIEMRGVGSAIAFEGIVVASGECSRDPRLQRIPFGDGLRALLVRVVDPSRSAIEGAEVSFTGANRQTQVARTDSTGTAMLVAPHDPIVVDITCDGYLSEEVADAKDSVVVVLRLDTSRTLPTDR